jgi:hypothetical protein
MEAADRLGTTAPLPPTDHRRGRTAGRRVRRDTRTPASHQHRRTHARPERAGRAQSHRVVRPSSGPRLRGRVHGQTVHSARSSSSSSRPRSTPASTHRCSLTCSTCSPDTPTETYSSGAATQQLFAGSSPTGPMRSVTRRGSRSSGRPRSRGKSDPDLRHRPGPAEREPPAQRPERITPDWIACNACPSNSRTSASPSAT